MKRIKGNALEWAIEAGHAMIHVCNNKGGYGGGKTALASQIRRTSQSAYTNYLKHYDQGGTASTSDCKSFINLIAQDGYGSRGKGVKYLREDWLRSSLRDVRRLCYYSYQKDDPTTIVVPYKMGCDRAGGNWKDVIKIVKEELDDYFDILVVEYDGG